MPIELPTYARSSKRLLDPYASATPTTSWGGIVGYILGIFLIIMVILVIINYTITPIFRLYPGGPGYIPIPGGDSSQVFWKQGGGKPAVVSPFFDISTNVVATSTQWSFALDIDITNPVHVSHSPRILFHRGPSIDASGTSPEGNSTTLHGLLGNYNVAFALLPDTTDLVVSVLTTDTMNNYMENVILQNVPVQTPFRVGVTISDTVMEVYLNGLLQRTRTFRPGSVPVNSTGMFYPPQAINAEIAKVANLHLWNSVISANQMRYASPGLMTVKPSDKSDIPTSSCLSGIEKEADSNLSSWSSTFQTNLGSLSSSIQSSVNSASSAIQSSMSTSPSTTSATLTTSPTPLTTSSMTSSMTTS